MSPTATAMPLIADEQNVKYGKRIFEGKQPGEDEDAGLGYKVLELVRFHYIL